MKNSCEIPIVIDSKGKEHYSYLYKQLRASLKKLAPEIVGLVYAAATTEHILDQFKHAGAAFDKYGEPTINAVWDYFKLDDVLNIKEKYDFIEEKLNSSDAFAEVERINSTDLRNVAYIEYNAETKKSVIRVLNREANYALYERYEDTKAAEAKLAELVKDNLGIDLEQLYKKIRTKFFKYKPNKTYYTLKNLLSQDVKYFSTEDLTTLLIIIQTVKPSLYKQIKSISNRTRRSDIIADIYTDKDSYSVISLIQNFQQTLYQNFSEVTVHRHDYEVDTQVTETGKRLRKLYRTKQLSGDLQRTNQEIKSVHDAAVHSIRRLTAQQDLLYNLMITKKLKEDTYNELKNRINNIEKLISNGRDTKAVSEALNEMSYTITYITLAFEQPTEAIGNPFYEMDQFTLGAKPDTKYWDRAGMPMHEIQFWTLLIKQYSEISAGYMMYLTEADKIIQKSILKTQIKKLQQFINTLSQQVNNKKTYLQTQLVMQITGNSVNNAQAILDACVSAQTGTWNIFKQFYSITAQSDKLCAYMGKYIRETQDARNQKIAEYKKRVDEIQYKLHGSTKFMFEPDHKHIISEIDWETYDREYETFVAHLIEDDLSEYDYQLQLRQWRKEHLTYYDIGNGKQELVPIYRKSYNPVSRLTPKQKQYYHAMMQLKTEVEAMIPDHALGHFIAPQVRRSSFQGMIDAVKHHSMYEIASVIKNWFKKAAVPVENSEFDYDNNKVLVHFTISGEPRKVIPIYTTHILKDSREQITDFSHCMNNLIKSAVNFQYMSEIENNIALLAEKYEEKVTLKAQTVFHVGSVKYTIPAKSDQVNPYRNIINGYIDNLMYGRISELSPTKRTVIKTLTKLTSILRLAVNVKGATANTLMGEIQTLIEAGGGIFYNIGDLVWAHKMLAGNLVTQGVPALLDWYNNTEHSKIVLLKKLFDPKDELYDSIGNTRYVYGARKLFSYNPTFTLYSSGEEYLHLLNLYAVLHHTRVIVPTPDGYKQMSLHDALDVKRSKGNAVYELKLKDGAKAIIKGEEVEIDDAFIEKLRKQIRYINHSTHGAMNKEDLGIIHRSALGMLFMNLRQWMVSQYSRRFKKAYYDADAEMEVEGYYRSLWKLLKNAFICSLDIADQGKNSWQRLNDFQKSNVRRALTEIAILGGIISALILLGSYKDTDSWWKRMLIYQLLRMRTEILATTPTPFLFTEGLKILNDPVAATTTLSFMTYPFTGLVMGDSSKKVQRGRHKGENKYWYNMKKYVIPFYAQLEQLWYFSEENSAFVYLNSWMPN